MQMKNDGPLVHLRNLLAFAPEDEDGVADYCAVALMRADFTVSMDHVGNLFAWRGVGRLCLNAHMDAIPQGIGADDRCGIAAILGAVGRRDTEMKVLLTTGEEQGGIGAAEVPCGWFAGIDLCASFDRHGNTDIITHYAGKQLAKDEVLAQVEKLAYDAGMDPVLTPSQSMADASTFALYTNCVNVATGFYKEHSAQEYCVRDDVVVAEAVAWRLMGEDWNKVAYPDQ